MPERYFEYHVFCCVNERAEGHSRGSCARGGADKLRDYMKSRAKKLKIQGMRVNMSGCLDRCELGPVMVVYPEGTWYHYDSKEDVDAILEQHIIGGTPVKRLMLAVDQKQLNG